MQNKKRNRYAQFISFISITVNLTPAYPMLGGRILRALLDELITILGRAVSQKTGKNVYTSFRKL
jgi:membrane-associated protease RseP (regulator of RpoE activity)